MNKEQITNLAYDALNEACRVMQQRLQVDTGDVAGIVFADGKIVEEFEKYIRIELEMRNEAASIYKKTVNKDTPQKPMLRAAPLPDKG